MPLLQSERGFAKVACITPERNALLTNQMIGHSSITGHRNGTDCPSAFFSRNDARVSDRAK
jgi:hypothetical protein